MKVNKQAVFASYTRRPTLIYISAHVSSPRVFGVYSWGRVSTDESFLHQLEHPHLVHNIVRPVAPHVYPNPLLLCLTRSLTLQIRLLGSLVTTLARYRISQRASVHAVRGQGVVPACPTSVAYTHSIHPTVSSIVCHTFLTPLLAY